MKQTLPRTSLIVRKWFTLANEIDKMCILATLSQIITAINECFKQMCLLMEEISLENFIKICIKTFFELDREQVREHPTQQNLHYVAIR